MHLSEACGNAAYEGLVGMTDDDYKKKLPLLNKAGVTPQYLRSACSLQ